MNTKQVIVIRKDLNMRRGKEIAQGSHASGSFMAVKLANLSRRSWLSRLWDLICLRPPIYLSVQEKDWLEGIFTKICVAVNSEQELEDIYQKAKEKGLPVHLITDSGKTEFNGIPTKTCLAIGPYESEKIDEVTGKLQLR